MPFHLVGCITYTVGTAIGLKLFFAVKTLSISHFSSHNTFTVSLHLLSVDAKGIVRTAGPFMERQRHSGMFSSYVFNRAENVHVKLEELLIAVLSDALAMQNHQACDTI